MEELGRGETLQHQNLSLYDYLTKYVKNGTYIAQNTWKNTQKFSVLEKNNGYQYQC